MFNICNWLPIELKKLLHNCEDKKHYYIESFYRELKDFLGEYEIIDNKLINACREVMRLYLYYIESDTLNELLACELKHKIKTIASNKKVIKNKEVMNCLNKIYANNKL